MADGGCATRVEKLAPPVVETRELLADSRAEPPDRTAARRDLLEHIHDAVRRWPRPEREVFELHFVEGLEPDEIAMVCHRPLKEIRSTIQTLQRRVRAEFLEAAQPPFHTD